MYISVVSRRRKYDRTKEKLIIETEFRLKKTKRGIGERKKTERSLCLIQGQENIKQHDHVHDIVFLVVMSTFMNEFEDHVKDSLFYQTLNQPIIFIRLCKINLTLAL